jgi:3'(2'), 5'-bisphosphate nucleotidase
MSSSLVLRLIASSVKIAERSGVIVRDILKAGDLGVVQKGWNDVQTEADRSVQRCILASLRKQFPGITVIGEEDEDTESADAKWVELSLSDEVLAHADKLPESLKNVKLEDICVWVDPLDGTAEYTQGLLDHVTVLIGVSVHGKSVAGVIYQPFYNYQAGPTAQLGRTIWGIIGLGAFGFNPNVADPSQRIVVTTRSHETEAVKNAIAACQPTEVCKVGGAGHKVLLLIEGKAHAYIFASAGCKKWDTCAPEAVLHAVGGKLTDMHGNLFQYHSTVKKVNTGGVLGTAKAEELDWYLSKIPDAVKNTLPA